MQTTKKVKLQLHSVLDRSEGLICSCLIGLAICRKVELLQSLSMQTRALPNDDSARIWLPCEVSAVPLGRILADSSDGCLRTTYTWRRLIIKYTLILNEWFAFKNIRGFLESRMTKGNYLVSFEPEKSWHSGHTVSL